jgi:hypothetical protein
MKREKISLALTVIILISNLACKNWDAAFGWFFCLLAEIRLMQEIRIAELRADRNK